MHIASQFPPREKVLNRWGIPIPPNEALAPPQEWIDAYISGFTFIADDERGVDADTDAWPNCAVFWWTLLDDSRRVQRIEEPWRGEEDGRGDAERLNEA